MDAYVSQVLQFVDTALNVVVLLAVVLGFSFKGWISGRIKAYFQSAVGKELEDHKHKLARELEGYKGGLLKDLEQYRADIDIKRSIALKMADARLDSLRKLAVAFNRFSNEAISTCRMNEAQKRVNFDEYLDSVVKFREAIRDAEIFLNRKLNLELATVSEEAVNMVARCHKENITLTMEDPAHGELVHDLATVSENVRNALVEEMPLKKVAA